MLSSQIQCLLGADRELQIKSLNFLVEASSVHYLGSTIDPTLSWNLHVSNIM